MTEVSVETSFANLRVLSFSLKFWLACWHQDPLETIALKLADNKYIAYWIITDLIRKDLCDEDNISYELLKNMFFSRTCYAWKPSLVPIPTIATMPVSVKRKTREGRYLPTRSKTFIDRLQTAKREKEELKIKLMLLNNRTKSLHRSKLKKKFES